MAGDAVRAYIKERMVRGDSAKAARESYNALIRQPPSFFKSNEWGRWRDLAGGSPINAFEVHKIQSALSRRERAERKEARAGFRLRTIVEREEAKVLGWPEPVVDYQVRHDAGIMFRATKQEHYREKFQEGSP